MEYHEDFSLKPYNTFGIDVKSRFFAEAENDEEICKLAGHLRAEYHPLLILGGGSNVLFTKDYPGTVLKVSTKGISVIKEDADYVWVRAQAGESWDDLVKHCVENGWCGLENLSGIPGKAGTSPVQNIGAYGVEIKDTLSELEAFDIQLNAKRIFINEECEFSYRESIFKKRYKGKFIILSVTFRLSKAPDLHLDYGNIREELAAMNVSIPGTADVRKAVCNIRARKIPDPAHIGNAGSFFKNPVVAYDEFEKLKALFPGIISFPHDGRIKLAAAWMIEQCGWKGKLSGNAGVHSTQPLVLINHNNAKGSEIVFLGEEIKKSVSEKFGISLETEVNII